MNQYLNQKIFYFKDLQNIVDVSLLYLVNKLLNLNEVNIIHKTHQSFLAVDLCKLQIILTLFYLIALLFNQFQLVISLFYVIKMNMHLKDLFFIALLNVIIYQLINFHP